MLLLHGQPGSAADWNRVVEALEGRVQSIAMQRPGYDGSPPGGVRHSASAALAALESRGIERAVVVGHSYGGAVAAWLAAFHPERVGGLVLVSAAANRASLMRPDGPLAAPVIGPLASAGRVLGSRLMLRVPTLARRIGLRSGLPDDFLAGVSRRGLRLASLRTVVVEQRAALEEVPGLEARRGGGAPPPRPAGSSPRRSPARSCRRSPAPATCSTSSTPTRSPGRSSGWPSPGSDDTGGPRLRV